MNGKVIDIKAQEATLILDLIKQEGKEWNFLPDLIWEDQEN